MTYNTNNTILIVEDDAHHADLIKRTIERACPDQGPELKRIADGESAVDYLRLMGTSLPRLIILDLKIPKLNGHEVLRFIKSSETLRVIPVVILTTSLSEQDKRTALELQANSVLTKSVNFSDFQQMLKDMINYWLGWNRAC